MQEMSIFFQHFFGLFNGFFFWLLREENPHPCPQPYQHTPTKELWGLSAPLFPEPLEMRKGPKGGSLASLWLLLSPPLIVVEGSPASPPCPPPWAAVLPRALWGPDCSEPRGLGAASLRLPPTSRCLVGGQSSGSPPADRWVPVASD